jgi:hypothetical protein
MDLGISICLKRTIVDKVNGKKSEQKWAVNRDERSGF